MTIRDLWLRVKHVSRAARRVINAGLAPLSLSSAEGNILLHLTGRGEAISQEALAGELDITKAAISRAVDQLARKDLVARTRDTGDRRQNLLSLTEEGLRVAPAVEKIYMDVFGQVTAGISQAEMAQLFALLDRVAAEFERGEGNA